MKKTKLLLFFLIIIPVLINAQSIEVNGIYYKFHTSISGPDYAEVVKNPNKYSGDIVIPETVIYNNNEYVVKYIAEEAFDNNHGLTSVSIPNSVTKIYNYAFYWCENLNSITMSNSVTSFGDYVFAYCSKLTSLEIPSTLTEIGYHVFDGCKKLNNIYISDLEAYCNIVSQSSIYYANHLYLNNTEIKDLVIPEGVTVIYNNAFYYFTGLTSVTIPSSVTEIKKEAFEGCSGLTSLIINNGISTIGEGAFENCTGLTSLTLPNSVTTIKAKAFKGCTSLETAVISSSISSVPQALFLDCTNLKSVTLPCTEISSISYDAFRNCSSLRDFYCYSVNVPTSGSGFFENASTEAAVLHVPQASLDTYKSRWDFFRLVVDLSASPKNLVYKVNGDVYESFQLYEGETINPIAEPSQEWYTFSGWSEIPATMPAEDLTITGTLSPAKYNLIYKIDGEEYMTVPTDYNSTITPEAAPTKEGYTFSGWSSIPETMPAEDVIITGTFSLNKYYLYYKVDGENYKTIQLDYNATITPEADPTKTGYTFSGWSAIPETMPAEDVAITGTFSINHHNLIYNVDGVLYKSYDVNYNADITPEPYPTKDGFKFGGWIDLPTKMPDEDVIVNGSFVEGEHTITYQVDGVDYKIQVYNHNDPITPESEPTREHYTFSGWSAIPEIMPSEDLIVTGSFTPDKFHLIYMVDDVEYKNYEIDYQATITPEAIPTREHYTFSGWSEIPETMPANDVTINGTFSADKFHLIYKVDGEEYKNYEVAYQSAITAEEAPTKEGYSFSGWSDIPATMPAEDVTITGTFTICKYNLTYKLDGNVYQTSEVEYGTPLTPIANPSVAVYHTFSGWSEVPATMPAHDVDIIGTSVPNKYNLTYKYSYSGNLFDYTTYKTVKVEYGATITPEPNATQEGYTFSGWSGVPATMPAYDVTVTGLFTANFYKLTYQVSGKASNSYSIRFGSTITPEAAPTVDGFTFNGWVGLPATMPAHDVTVNASLTKNATSSVTYPADWDMTGWSEETVSNLESDSKWYKSEYRYSYNGSCPKDESIELIANGVKIKETAGIEFAISNCSLFTISTKEGGLYNVNIEVFESSNFFFVLKNMKRGQKVSIDFRSVDWYTDNDLFPQPVGAVKMTDRPITRAQRTESSVADYIVSADGDVRFNVNADKFFYLYNVDVTAVSNDYLSYLSNTEGINNQIDCYLYWNGKSSSAIGPWGSSYARGADVRIENKSNQTMTITRIELYDGATSLKTVTDLNGDLAPGNYKDFSFSVSSTSEMPSTLPWMEVYYDVNGASYIKKFVSDGTQPPGSSSSGESGGSDESGTGINDHRADEENGEHEDIYTIDGKKLGSYPTKKGLYIKNGKKFVVK